MKFLYFGDTMDKGYNREQSLLAKIWFKENVLKTPPTSFDWTNTTIIQHLQEFGYDGLFFDLSQLTHARTMERQYLTRIILRLADDRQRTLYVAMNKDTYDLLVKESIKDITKTPNLFLNDNVKGITKWLKDVKNVS